MKFPEEYHPLLEMINVFDDNGERKLSHDLCPGDVIFVYQYSIDNDRLETTLVSARVVVQARCKDGLFELRATWEDGRVRHIYPQIALLTFEELERKLKEHDGKHFVYRAFFTFKKDCNTVTLTDGRRS